MAKYRLFGIVAVLAFLFFIFKEGFLPSNANLIEIFKTLFANYGKIIVFLAALLEGLIIIGYYLPGSVLIFTSILLSLGDFSQILTYLFVIYSGLFLAQIINYSIGYFGFNSIGKPDQKYISDMQNRFYLRMFYLSSFPNLLSVTSLACGYTKISFVKFISTVAITLLMWNTFWVMIIYMLGPAAIQLVGVQAVIAVLVLLLLYEFYKYNKSKK